VHLTAWPQPRGHAAALGADAVELVEGIRLVQKIVGLGRAARNTHELKTRQPLGSVTLVARHEMGLDQRLARFGELVRDELNVKALRMAEERSQFVTQEVRPNFRALGKRLGGQMPKVKAALEGADGDALAAALEAQGWVEVTVDSQPVRLGPDEVEVRLVEKPGLATAGDRDLLVALDTELTPALVAEGLAREVVHRIQAARKDAALDYADRIRVAFRAAPELAAAIAAHRDWIAGETLAVELAERDGGELPAAPVEGHDFAFAMERA
jgi:isoleucyl-tRNA synthetase